MSTDPGVMKCYANASGVEISQRHAFIGNCDIARELL